LFSSELFYYYRCFFAFSFHAFIDISPPFLHSFILRSAGSAAITPISLCFFATFSPFHRFRRCFAISFHFAARLILPSFRR